jgi:hypothetical protein
MDNFEILNVFFYPSEEEIKGYVKIKVEDKILEYDFEYGDNRYDPDETDFTRIEKKYDKKTNKEYNSYEIFDKLNRMIPVHKKDDKLYKEIEIDKFNEYFTTKIEKQITTGLASKYKNDIDIISIELKSFLGEFIFRSKLSIFGREMEFEIFKSHDFFNIQNMNKIFKKDLENWFFNKIVTNRKNEKDSLFYVGKITEEHYNFVDIIGSLIMEKYKKTAQYKMTVLYDPEIKRRLE